MNMKKTIAILLVLAVVMTGLFAAPPTAGDATLTLNGKVGAVLKHGLSDSTMGVESIKDAALYTPGATSEKVLFDAESVKENVKVFYSYMTNWKGTVTATAKFNPLASADVDTKVGYTVKIGADTPTAVASSDANKAIVLFNGVSTGTAGFAGAEKELVFNADAADYKAAAADNYTATVTFEIAAN